MPIAPFSSLILEINYIILEYFSTDDVTKHDDSMLMSIGDIEYDKISSGDDIDDIIGDMNDDEQDEYSGRKSGAFPLKPDMSFICG